MVSPQVDSEVKNSHGPDYDRRDVLALGVSVFAGIAGGSTAVVRAWNERQKIAANGKPSDWPSRNEKDFLALVPVFPKQGVVGYLRSESQEPDLSRSAYYQLAQHALVPLIFQPFDDQRYVLANFQTNRELEVVIQDHEFKLLANVAPGLAAFENLNPRASASDHLQ